MTDSTPITVLKAREAISELLDPISWESFVSEYWDQRALHTSVRGNPFRLYATPAEVRTLIETGLPWQFRRMPELYLDGGRVSHDDVVDSYIDMDGREAKAPKLERIRALLRAGATVNAFGQDAHFAKLAEIRHNFSLAFGAEVEIATFYSQGGHPGLAPHYDCVEIFVLQIFGHKQWHVSSQRASTPLVGYGAGTWFDPSAPHAEIDLEAGDVLYLPRGTFHHAVAMSDESLHATVAVKVPSYVDALSVLVGTAPDVETMRAYLPLLTATAGEEMKKALLARIAQVLNGSEFDERFRKLTLTRSRG